MTTTNQPSDAAKAILAELRKAENVAREASKYSTEMAFADHYRAIVAAEDLAAALVIDRRLTPSEPVSEPHQLLSRAYEVVHHDPECMGIGRGDEHCTCDAVPFLKDLARICQSPPAPVNSDVGLVEETKRLRGIIERAGQHWLDLQGEHPIMWEGALDGAVKAACDHIRALSAIPTPAVNAELVEAISRGLICEVMEAGNLSLHIDFGKNREAARKVRDFLSRAEGERA